MGSDPKPPDNKEGHEARTKLNKTSKDEGGSLIGGAQQGGVTQDKLRVRKSTYSTRRTQDQSKQLLRSPVLISGKGCVPRVKTVYSDMKMPPHPLNLPRARRKVLNILRA